MSTRERLNQIGPRISNSDFRSQTGIGNEIACYIFDYPPKDEEVVRTYLPVLMNHLQSEHPNETAFHLDLFDVLIEYLDQRKLLTQTLKMQGRKSDKEILKALRGPLSIERFRDYLQSQYELDKADMVLMSGVGRVWPMLRMHSLLNALHVPMETTPLILFYPGCFDGTSLSLFCNASEENTAPNQRPYYRAFTLVPGGPTT